MIKIPELLAPAGTLESFKTAFLYGADAVYAGIPAYSMRARAKITIDEMKEGIDFAHSINKKVYLAFNLFAKDSDYQNLERVSQTINYLNPDALIVADPGIVNYVKENHPSLPIHISTQANICSSYTVKFWQSAGASLCVLARELSHKDFLEIRKKCPDIKLEIFIHGAMCMSYSGRCLLSNYITGRPANRGACAQLCRWKYDIILRDENGHEMFLEEDNRGTYLMNSKDLCLMPKLADVIESGADSLKIEGRNRSEYYVGSVVRAYRLAIDSYINSKEDFNPDIFMNELNVLETRGYTTAFFDGPLAIDAHNFESSRSKSDYKVAGVIRELKNDHIIFELRNEIKTGDIIFFILPNQIQKIECKLDILINAKDDSIVPKLSAGQGNSIKIPINKFSENIISSLSKFILAYKTI